MRKNGRSVVVAKSQDPAHPSEPNGIKAGVSETLFGSLVITRRATGFAIHQAVGANADIDDRLAETAILLALAVSFGLLTLRATIFRETGRNAHEVNASATGRRDET